MKCLHFVKPALLGALLVFSPITPAAFAETVELMILNTRGEDGIYRPALRIVRGGTVTFIAAGTQGLTEAALRDSSLLKAWLVANVSSSDPDTEITFVVTEIRADPPASEEEVKDCLKTECSKEESVKYCTSKFPDSSDKFVFEGFNSTPEGYCFD